MDGRAREELVKHHLELARKAAALIHPRVRDHVAYDELVALGNAGLAEAASRFDPERGVAFATYAWYRVNGAIVDGLRQSTQLPRRIWAQLLALRAAGEYLEHAIEHDATEGNASALAEVQRAMSAIRTMYLTSFEAMCDDGFDVPGDAPAPPDRLESSRLAARLRDAIARLPDKERILITSHYWDGKNLLEIGRELGISKSWSSRMHAQIVDKLRAMIDGE